MTRAALVTGAARRLGREMTLRLADLGWDVAVHYHESEDEAMDLAARIEALGRRCVLLEADLMDRHAVRRLVPRALSAFPELALLVNNASVFEKARFPDTDEELFDRQFEINFRSAVFLTHDFASHVDEGHVVNLLDSRVARCVVAHFAYTLSKKALAEFTRMAARALGPTCRVNAICPGLILPAEGAAGGDFEAMAARVPLQREGAASDVADALEALLANEYLTGQFVYVDGGQHLL